MGIRGGALRGIGETSGRVVEEVQIVGVIEEAMTGGGTKGNPSGGNTGAEVGPHGAKP